MLWMAGLPVLHPHSSASCRVGFAAVDDSVSSASYASASLMHDIHD